jgi:hypothetical protein
MSTGLKSASHFATRALAHAQALAASPRGSATVAESQAAEYVQAECKSMGIEDVHLEPFSGLRSIWLFLALAFGLALVGHAAFWLLRQPAGDVPPCSSAYLPSASGLLVWRKFTFVIIPRNDAPRTEPNVPVIPIRVAHLR